MQSFTKFTDNSDRILTKETLNSMRPRRWLSLKYTTEKKEKVLGNYSHERMSRDIGREIVFLPGSLVQLKYKITRVPYRIKTCSLCSYCFVRVQIPT